MAVWRKPQINKIFIIIQKQILKCFRWP